MKRAVLLACVAYTLCICLTGCGRLMEWGKCQFNQGCDLPTNICCVQEYMRTVRVYDEFHTVGMFDVLWLAPAVREATVDLHAVKYGMTVQQRQSAYAHEEREDQQYIDFYVLAFQPRSMGNIFEGGNNAQWSSILILNNIKYEPESIRHIYRQDVDLIWKHLLGAKINSHRRVYKIRFKAQNSDGKPRMQASTREMSMCLRRFDQQAGLCWKLCGPNALSRESDCLPCCNESGCEQCGACAECAPDDVCCVKKDGI